MVCEAVVVLPHASVAVHVLVTEYSVAQGPGVVRSLNLRVVGPQPSDDVGPENTGVAGHWIVSFAPTPVITGIVLSSTVMVCEAVTVLPQASVAVHVLVTEYSVVQGPGVVTSLNVRVVCPQASEEVGIENAGVVGHWIV